MVKEMKEGKRGVYAQILREFALLHKVLTVDLGVEVFLFTHQIYEKIPDAVFVRDWFSTHSPAEHGLPTLILYAMRAPSRRLEKRDELVTFLAGRYQTVINFSPCEAGTVDAIDKIKLGQIKYSDSDGFLAASPVLETNSTGPCKPIESSSFSLDRISKTAFYASPSPRLNEQAMELWGKRMGYKLHRFQLDESALKGKHIHHTRAMLCIGTSFAFVCTEIVVEQDRAAVRHSLQLASF